MNKTVKYTFALSALVLSLSAQAENIVIGYQTGVDPSKVPQAAGTYQKEIGQPLEWRRFDSGPGVVAALVSGAIQIGDLGSSPFAAAASRGAPIVAFLVADQIQSSEALVVRNGSGIRSFADLKGKTIATPFVSTSHFSLLGALQHWGLSEKQVNIVNLQPLEIAAAWKRGDIDGAFVWSPALSEIEKTGTVLTDAAQVGKWGHPTFEVWVARKDFAEKHPEVLKKFAAVSLASFDDYRQHPEKWNAGSANAAATARLVGVNAADVPALISGNRYPDASEQVSPEFLGGGTVKATAETAQFLYQQKRISGVLPDYSPYVSSQYIPESR
ncbi:taurine ABC transporter substrate-binding protein [Tatumella sp. JGM118]|uniref:Taurine ABC transporter substrate-binding protein n=1 Tax=Tatumella terrea TaxID=419007 RepID=A0ABW1W2I9_9GAMM|nr:taurine ABC transporter substrate-binding protein [Tatumella sp. JGM118]MBS0910823.1 taurine ABC transporter substrate-binding protein [Tatumella sp. JGM118]